MDEQRNFWKVEKLVEIFVYASNPDDSLVILILYKVLPYCQCHSINASLMLDSKY